MDIMISCCGITCNECDAFIGAQTDNSELLAQIAEKWNEQYGADFTAESVKCDGCNSESERLCGYCHICGIRACCQSKGFENCAHCEDYGCEKVKPVFDAAPETKKTLDEIRAGL